MISARRITLVASVAFGTALGAFSVAALQTQANEGTTLTSETTTDAREITIRCECAKEEKDWTDEALENLAAETSLEQSVYLSAVQMVKIERANENVRDAIPKLESLLQRVPKQNLKNAIRRLIVEIQLEEGDHKGRKDAEEQLKKIIDESLVQF